MATITLDDITKRYDDGYEAVKHLDLEVADAEFLILVGPSGCGKSTALRMIAGLEDITDGRLLIDGAVVNDRAPKDRDIAMVFQSYALYPHMTVGENMAFPLKLAKLPQEEIDRRVADTAKILDLEQHLDRKPANLSGGQRQRVAMGRAIVRSPSVFLMDEPLSNLDAKLRVQMRTEVSRIQSRLETTTIYVTHDQTEAMTLGDRVAVMRAGILQQVDTPKNLYERPDNLFVAGFIGSPSMNFFLGTVEGDHLRLPFVDVPLDDAHRRALESGGIRGDIIVGIRPEHFEDATLVGDQSVHGVTFDAPIEVTESMGSEVYAYFAYEGGDVTHDELADLAADTGAADLPDTGGRAVARLDAETSIAHGSPAKLWMDSSRIQLFDPEDGRAIRAEATSAPAAAPTA
ncbi:MAG TPA: sn-glycerol-3-phosphate ABC transporter ATP-binding protein UgpC [Baekduia sp.]|uniref:ABC transporter ATP-binding protein n=1 Tax=Baekduia sp. TaxID=2600305 RepID=UPI002BDD3D6B|nr:sn-glycerol-3-phosphate ABC transporter ATP-binding protein UgpC [Baekduia sp.]HMJ34854.1 sn-glycerol-3-phosphate ABC transporter ATP-binding protein UgpC [Baekduia sp.]